MKKTTLFFFIIITVTFQAQTIKLTKGVDFENGNWSSRMIEHNDKGFYYLTHGGGTFSTNYVLLKCDLTNVKFIYERVIDLKDENYT